MSFPELPRHLTDELNRVAFKNDARKFKEVFQNEDYDTIVALFPEKSALQEALKTLALQENAAMFRTLLEKFGRDADALSAILDGFKADERFNAQDASPYSAPKTPADLEEKRAALRDFAVSIRRKPPAPHG